MVYHDSSAKGLLLRTKPIVLGFVACSRAYATPVTFQASQRLSPSCSTSDSAESFTADAGRLIEQKLTNPVSFLSKQSNHGQKLEGRSYDAQLRSLSAIYNFESLVG